MIYAKADLSLAQIQDRLQNCHVIITQNLFDRWKEYYQTDIFAVDVMESIFRQSVSSLRLIHLNHAKSHGQKQYHGLPFQKEIEEDREQLRNILRLYHQYGNNCPVTIEVREQDYRNAINFQTTLEAWKQEKKEKK